MGLHKPPPGAVVSSPEEDIAKKRKELLTRAGGSSLVVLFIVGGIYVGGWLWSVVASAIAIGSLWEYYRMMHFKFKLSKGWGLAGALLMLMSVSLGFSYSATMCITAMIAFLVLFTEVVRRQSTGTSFALWNIGGVLGGLIYIVLPWSFMIVIRSQTWGHIFLLTIFFCTWSCDVGAYLVGSYFGQTPFCSNVSPKKTWEGFWAGVCSSMLCGAAVAIPFDFPPIPLLLLGAICGVAGQLGDLGESVLKREADIKESGNIIPGHGGFLDRFDSILINATLAFFIFEVIG